MNLNIGLPPLNGYIFEKTMTGDTSKKLTCKSDPEKRYSASFAFSAFFAGASDKLAEVLIGAYIYL